MQADSPHTSFLPDFCAIRMVFAWVVTAELLAVVLTLAASPGDFWSALSLRSLYVQWIALSLVGLMCLSRRFLSRLSHTLAGLLVWGLSLLITAAIFFIARHVLGSEPQVDWRALAFHLGISAIVMAIVLRYLYEMHRERLHQAAEARARAQALQARIRPHFLFNSMNTIASMTRSEPRLAEELVHDFSDLFRASLSEVGQWSSLAREIELAEGYLRIEAQRLGDRLSVNWDLQDLPLQARMPPLLLQPLLENAVYHGIEPALGGGRIEVCGRYRRGLVNISISNTLPEQTESQRSRKGNQMAQSNVRERLQAAFDGRADMRIGEVDGLYQVRLVIPYDGGEG